ncbi:MAG: diadenylate cyclase CdaA [Lentisphaeria bacterium]|nr:diadenylate cyclase CdaA [Lentisphaeria bacterium]
MSGFVVIDALRAALQIGILFLMIYAVLYYLRSTRGAMVITGLFILGLFLAIIVRVEGLNLDVLAYILDMFGNSLFVAMLIIFQPELRRALAQLGSYIARQGKQRREVVSEIVAAVTAMSRRKCGALIVVERRFNLQTLIDDSIPLDIKINALVLESIFFPNSPLHDGAVIIRNNRIVAARAILPLTRAEHVSRHLGTRHRAALGISEESDAVTIVVSEETGFISLAYRGIFHRDTTPEELQELLEQLVVLKDDGELSETVKMLEERENVPEKAEEEKPDDA